MPRQTRNSTGFYDPQQLVSLPKRRNNRKSKKDNTVEEIKKEPDEEHGSGQTEEEKNIQNGSVEEPTEVVIATNGPDAVSEETKLAIAAEGGSPNINTCYSPTICETHDDYPETAASAIDTVQSAEPAENVVKQNLINDLQVPSASNTVSVDDKDLLLQEITTAPTEIVPSEPVLVKHEMPEISEVVQNATETLATEEGQHQVETVVVVKEPIVVTEETLVVEPMDTTDEEIKSLASFENTAVGTTYLNESDLVELKVETPVTFGDISRDTCPKESEFQKVNAEIPVTSADLSSEKVDSVEVKLETPVVSENLKRQADSSEIELTKIEPETPTTVENTLFGLTVNETSASSSFLGASSFFALKQEPGVIPGLDFDAAEDVSDKVEQITFGSIMAKKMFAAEPERPAERQMHEAEIADLKDEDKNLRRSSRIRSQESGRSRRREVVFSNRNGTSSGASSRSQSVVDDEDMYHNFELQHLRSPSRDSVSSRSSSHIGGSPDSDEDDKSIKRRTNDDEDLAEAVSSVDLADRPSSRKAAFVPPKDLVRMPGHIAFTANDEELKEKLKTFDGIEESRFFTERRISKESKSMICDCFLSKEDIQRGEIGCNEDCLNRLLMVECGSRCPTGDRCTNKRFQRREYCPLEVFKTEKKGHGLRTLAPLAAGGFVIEYVGEVLNPRGFTKRTKEYAKKEQEHFYFMALTSDTIIDATLKGNCSRFINHSCEPNCETQKWTVNGEVRIGFFAQRDLRAGEEITFDYQFQRYGKNAQRCFCMTESCRGWIGGDEEDEEYDEDEDEAKETGREEVAGRKLKVKTPRRRKKRVTSEVNEFGDRFYEDLKVLETSGLKNKNHTLNLCRLMVRAEDWESRDRILNILINGDQPCRRLFLDYRGLRLLHGWMSTLPALTNSAETEHYHLKFLQALEVLPIPNKTLLKDSEILDLVEKWSSEANRKKDFKIQEELRTRDQKQEEGTGVNEQTEPEIKEQVDVVPEPAKEAVEVTTEQEWRYARISQKLLDNWADLKEVFRIPKKERVEQMKEHEREADKADNVQKENDKQSDKDSLEREKFSQRKFDRKFNLRDFFQAVVKSGVIRPSEFKHLSKEQKRHFFAEYIANAEKQQQHEQMNANLQVLHTERCKQLNLNYETVPYVDPTGLYWLEPKSMTWNAIEMDDMTLNPGVKTIANFVHNPPPPVIYEPQVLPPQEHQEVSFPPWPESFPPPPKLVPANLPSGWAINFDEEGRLYFYHARTRITQWEVPTNQTLDFCDAPSSSDSSDMEDDGGEINDDNTQLGGDENLEPVFKARKISKSEERRVRRKLSGLVQEKIISPRTEEDKPALTQKMIKQRKLELMTERVQGTLYDEDDDTEAATEGSVPEPVELRPPSRKKRRTSKSSSVSSVSSIDSSSIASTDDLEELNLVAFGGPEVATVSESPTSSDSQVTAIKLKSHDRKRSHKKAKSRGKEAPGNPHSSSKGSKERKMQEDGFRLEIANLIKQYLNPFRKPECTSGKITNTEHFKHLARKLTHMVTAKEIKHCKNSKQNESLAVTDSVKHKAKEFVRKYMARFQGRDYVPSPENHGSVATGSES